MRGITLERYDEAFGDRLRGARAENPESCHLL
jgi:hypothetical protein